MSRTFGTLVIVCCVALLYSCNTVKLHKIALYSKTDSVAVNHYDSGNVSSKTVHSASTVDSAVKSSVSSFTGQGVTVNFDTAGSAGFVDGPITIEQQEGKTIVSAPGRKIKSITAHNNSATQTSNTVELYKADTLNITTLDSGQVHKDDSTALSKESKAMAKDKETNRIPVIGIAILAVLMVGFLYCWKEFHKPLKDMDI